MFFFFCWLRVDTTTPSSGIIFTNYIIQRQTNNNRYYEKGAAYPVGGSSAIARHILPVITRGGGGVVCNAEVDRISVDSKTGAADGVVLASGELVPAKKAVVLSCGFRNTVERLLPAEEHTGDFQPRQDVLAKLPASR